MANKATSIPLPLCFVFIHNRLLIGIGITILRDAQVVTIVLRTLVKEIEGQSVRRPIVSRPSRHLALFRDHMGSEHAPYPKQHANQRQEEDRQGHRGNHTLETRVKWGPGALNMEASRSPGHRVVTPEVRLSRIVGRQGRGVKGVGKGQGKLSAIGRSRGGSRNVNP